jgi:hypothetical protein
MKVLNRAYLLLAMVAGVVGVAQCFQWYEIYDTVNIVCALKFLPAVVFLIAYVMSRKTNRITTHIVAIPFCIFAVGFWIFVSIVVDGLATMTTEVTAVKQYDTILNDRRSLCSELVQHFPRPIPSNAKDVRFSFLPAFLQGGVRVQLRYSASPAVISDLYERYSGQKTKSFLGGDANIHMNAKEGMPTTFFYTSGSADRRFPDDYEIMIFDRVAKENRPPDFCWNHGKSHGVAISKKRNEIVYWAESW